MSTVDQAMADTTVPVAHTLLRTQDLTARQILKVDNGFILSHPGFLLVRDTLTKLECIADDELPESAFRSTNEHYFQAGFPHDFQDYPYRSGLTEFVPTAVQIMRSMTREQFIRVIAPLFIYARSHIRSGYGPEDEAVESEDGYELRESSDYEFIDLLEIAADTQPVKADLIPEAVSREITNKFLIQEAYESCGLSRRHFGVTTGGSFIFTFSDSELSVTSTGIFFREGAEIEFDCFDVPYAGRPSNPYASNAPSPRSVIVRLLRELNAQSDLNLISIGVSLLTGMYVQADLRKAQAQNGESVMVRSLSNIEEDLWPLMYPGESVAEPIFRKGE